jgi:hypothetical protein
MTKIFISYRRDDSADVAGRIHDQLASRFGNDNVFLDTEAIPVGVEFPEYIRRHIAQSKVFLALIGDLWLEIKDSQNNRRLDDERDLVRKEIEQALEQGMKIVPVLLKAAKMPTAEQLPPSIQGLAAINCVTVRGGPDFKNDFRVLMTTICETLGVRLDPVHNVLVSRACLLATAAIAGLFTAGGLWLQTYVDSLDFWFVALASWPVAGAVGVSVYRLTHEISRNRLAIYSLIALLACLVPITWFSSIWTAHTDYIPSRNEWFLRTDRFAPQFYDPHFEFISDQQIEALKQRGKTEELKRLDQIKAQTALELQKKMEQYRDDPRYALEQVSYNVRSLYDPAELESVKLSIQTAWLAIAINAMIVVGLLVALI